MKRFAIAITTVVLIIFTSFHAQAGSREVDGLLIGAGSGALIGQAIGNNTESTLLGAAVGGVIGYTVSNDRHHRGHKSYSHRKHHYKDHHRGHHYKTPRSYGHKHYRPSGMRHYRGDRYYRPFGDRHDRFRPHYRDRKDNCREVVRIKTYNGQTKRVYSTICWDGGSRGYRDHFNHRRF